MPDPQLAVLNDVGTIPDNNTHHAPVEGRNTAMSALRSPSKSPGLGPYTCSENDALVVRPRAVAKTVMVVLPTWPGVIVSVRFAPDPPTARFARGTTAVLDEKAAIVRAAAPPTVKFTTSGRCRRVARLG